MMDLDMVLSGFSNGQLVRMVGLDVNRSERQLGPHARATRMSRLGAVWGHSVSRASQNHL